MIVEWLLFSSHFDWGVFHILIFIVFFVWSMYGLSKVRHRHSWESIPCD